MLAKLTLVRHGLPHDRTLVRGFGQEPDVLLLRGVPAEISAKRAVQLLGCSDFEVEFAEGELDDIDESKLNCVLDLLKMNSAEQLKKELSPKKSVVKKVVEQVLPTTTKKAEVVEETVSEESSEEAVLADESE